MWFSSIWIFTLRLPWQWGADLFLRHLLDGDPASNTLSWRWVAGLHTKGRTYLARADNIARYTDGRFNPKGLADHAAPLREDDTHPLRPVPEDSALPAAPALLLVTEDDCSPETLIPPAGCTAAYVATPAPRSDRPTASRVTAWTAAALADATQRLAALGLPTHSGPLEAAALIAAAQAAGAEAIVTPHVPVGPAGDALATLRPALHDAGLPLHTVLRPEDRAAWTHAARGFFQLKAKIPALLADVA